MKRCRTRSSFVLFALLAIPLGSGQSKALAQDAAEKPRTIEFQMKHADAEAVEKIVKDVYKDYEKEGKLKIGGDARRQTLLISGADELIKEIEALLKALDAAAAEAATKPKVVNVKPLNETKSPPQAAAGQPKTVVFSLKHADAEAVEKTIQALYADAEGAGPAKIVAEGRTNTLLVSAPADIVKQIEELLKILDAAPSAPAESSEVIKAGKEIKVFTLQNALAESSLEVAKELMKGAVEITADHRTNSLIATGKIADLRVLEAILLRLDEQQKQPADFVTIYELKHAHLDNAVKTLTQLGMLGNFAADEANHRLLVRGDESDHKLISEMLRTIDVPQARPNLQPIQLRIVWLVDEKLAGKDAREPAKNLERVLKVLEEKLGVTKLKMAAQLLVTVDPGNDGSEQVFTAHGTTELNQEVKTGLTDLEAEGKITGQTGSNPTIELMIRAGSLAGFGGVVDERGGSRHISDLLTSLTTKVVAPAGHSIVLGMTPIQSADSVFILQVLSNDDAPAAK